MEPFRTPNINKPRAKLSSAKIWNIYTYLNIIKKHPHLKKYTFKQMGAVVRTFNNLIIKNVTECRDGVELPKGLGYLFIGSCKKKENNPNMAESLRLGYKVQNLNLESNRWLCKIFYTNFETKYSFKNHDLWHLLPGRPFKKTVSDAYIKDYTKYIIAPGMKFISKLFRQRKYKLFAKDKDQEYLDSGKHNEFDI